MTRHVWTAMRLVTRILNFSALSRIAVQRAERAKTSNVNQPGALDHRLTTFWDTKNSALGWFSRRAVLLSLVLLLGASVMWAGQAPPQQAAPAATTFTGKVGRAAAEGVTTGLVIFEPGARTYWHSHPNGQLLLAQKGRLRTQKQGGAVRELGLGEPEYAGPNIRHWHGATPTEQLTQLTIGFGGTTKWEEEVTEPQYLGKAK